MNEKRELRGFFCLALPTFLGDALLTLRFSQNTADDLIGYISAILISLLAAIALKWATELAEKGRLKRMVATVANRVKILVLCFSAILTAVSFSKYAAEVMLGGTAVLLPFVTFGLLFVFMGLRDKGFLLRLSVPICFVVVICILLMFGFSARFMSLKYFVPYKAPTLSGSLSVFSTLCPSLLMSVVAIGEMGRKLLKKQLALCIGLCGGLLVLCGANVLGVFGSELASSFLYPYSSAVATAALGHVFSRLDGLLYAVCFFTCGIKVAVSLFALIRLLKEN